MKNKEIILILLFLALICVVGYGVDRISVESVECLESPFIYGATQYKEANDNIEFTCSCSFEKPGSPVFYFNSTGVYRADPKPIQFVWNQTE